mmetsp:Transcript_13295/g.39641  ORF Transcript_13295/g.39641 Transcript_13295/m.39641 type:complete len:216 (-) Transcript_13295:219-866(-)
MPAFRDCRWYTTRSAPGPKPFILPLPLAPSPIANSPPLPSPLKPSPLKPPPLKPSPLPPKPPAGAPPPEPLGPLLGKARRTLLPQISAPCIRRITVSTSRLVANSTKPKPFERPVSLSTTIRATFTSATLLNSAFKFSSVHVKEMPPTNILVPASSALCADVGGAPPRSLKREGGCAAGGGCGGMLPRPGGCFTSTDTCRPRSSAFCRARTARVA